MLVSVIIPTCNRKKFLRKALDSVLNQTYDNFEIIVIDDCSCDDTKGMVLSYKDRRIKYFQNTSKLYAAESRNIGIERSNGDFIAFLDDDDEWLPDKLTMQMPLFRKNSKVGIVYSSISLFFSDYNLSYNTKPEKRGMIFKDLLIKNYIGGTVSVVVRKEVFSNVFDGKYFDPNFKAREEYDLWVRISKKWEVDYIDTPLVTAYYRNDIDRVSSNVDNYVKGIDLLNYKYEKEVQSLLSMREKNDREFFQCFFLGSQAIKINNSKLARRYYLKAFRVNKDIKSGVIYLLCFFGYLMATPRFLFSLMIDLIVLQNFQYFQS